MKSWMSRIKGWSQNAKTAQILLANVTKSVRVRMEVMCRRKAQLSKQAMENLISAKRKLIELTSVAFEDIDMVHSQKLLAFMPNLLKQFKNMNPNLFNDLSNKYKDYVQK